MSAASKVPSTAGSGVPKSSKARSSSPVLSGYLFLYNGVSFALWGYILLSAIRLLATKYALGDSTIQVSSIYAILFPTLLWTQTLAVLEVIHSLLGLVRASFMTTLMQVASRLFVVWPVLFCFGSHGYFTETIGENKAITKSDGLGSYAFVGCIIAWGITECVRYSFFCIQVAGAQTPALIQWLRYNMFFVLYPVGIASECTLTYLSLGPARQVHDLFAGLFVVVLLIYVPGSYVLYTHMMSQRRKVMRKQHQKTQ